MIPHNLYLYLRVRPAFEGYNIFKLNDVSVRLAMSVEAASLKDNLINQVTEKQVTALSTRTSIDRQTTIDDIHEVIYEHITYLVQTHCGIKKFYNRTIQEDTDEVIGELYDKMKEARRDTDSLPTDSVEFQRASYTEKRLKNE